MNSTRLILCVLLAWLAASSLHAFSDMRVIYYEKDSLLAARGTALVTAGLPFAQGEVTAPGQIAIFDGSGAAQVPAQFTPLVRYTDGSYQWVLADILSPVTPRDTTRFVVKNTAPAASPVLSISVDSTAADYTVNTGVIRFRVKRSGFNFIDALWHGSTQLIGGSGGGIKINDGTDRWGTTVNACYFEYLGPIRATLRVDGTFFTAAQGGMTFRVRFHAFAGSDAVRIETSVRNSSNPTYGAYTKLTNGGDVYLPFAAGLSGAVMKAGKDTLVQNWQTAYNWSESGTHGILAAARLIGGFTPKMQYNRLSL
jgi:hypothetical protein